MADNFVSYARDDKALITTLVAALEGEGFTVFWDPDIMEGDDWELVIEDQLNAAKAVIVAWTSNSRRSQWVRAEAHEAHRQRKLIPLQLDPSGPPLFFKTVQTADFIGWNGDKSAECWQRLSLMLKGVMEAADRQKVEQPGDTPTPPPMEMPAAVDELTPDQPPRITPKPKPLHATPQRGLPWPTIIAGVLGIGGFLLASQLHSSVLGGAILIAAVIFILFRTADRQMPPAFHALAKRWLMPVQGGLRINVAEAFHDMFKAVFWHRHISWQCFVRSAVASTVAFAAIFAFAWVFIEPFQTAFRAEWGSFLRNLVITFLIANILADYLSLFQTRLFIRFLERQPWTAPFVVILDFFATMAILLVVLYLVNACSQWFGHMLSTGAEPGGLTVEDGGPVREAAAAGFTWPSFMGFYEGLIPQLSNPQAGIADLWARSWLLIVASITTYITSVWLLFIMVFGAALRVLVGRDGEPTWLGRALEARQRPFTAFGSMSAAFVMFLAAPVYGLEAAGMLSVASTNDTTLDGQEDPPPPPELDPEVVEQQAWERAQQANTLEGYRRYVDDHPLGAHMAEARERIAALQEAQAWGQAQTADSISGYERYLAVYPTAANAAEARSRIADIESEDALASEQAAWVQAQRDDTIGAYERYLESHPDGANAQTAQARIAALTDEAAWRVAQEDGTLASYVEYLADFTNGDRALATYSDDAQRAIDAHTAAVERVQRALLETGFDPRGVDGAAGPGTVSAASLFVRESVAEGDERAAIAPDFEAIDPEPIIAFAELVEAWERPSPGGRAGDSFRDCDVCPEMVVIPAGRFTMGSPSSEADRNANEGPQHEVTIPAPFAVGQYEVMWAEWEACVADGGCEGSRTNDQGWGRGRRPVITVSWEDAQAYARWLSARTGETYRLPSEAEWEYAARAGTKTRFSTGDDITTAQANFRGDTYLEQTVPVGSYGANPFGLYDMHGNVWEWVEDCYRDSYSGAPTDGSSVTASDCSRRVLRGGSWGNVPQYLRSADRSWNYPSDRLGWLGFRVARTVLPE